MNGEYRGWDESIFERKKVCKELINSSGARRLLGEALPAPLPQPMSGISLLPRKIQFSERYATLKLRFENCGGVGSQDLEASEVL